MKIVNDAGGIKGRKLRYVPEDTGYKVDVSVAAFKKITSQNKVNLYYGDSTGFSKTINPELDRTRPDADGRRLVRDRAQRPGRSTRTSSSSGPTTPRWSASCCEHIAKEKPGAKVAFVYSDTEFGRDPIDEAARPPPRSSA